MQLRRVKILSRENACPCKTDIVRDTKRFNNSAVGFITSGVMLKTAIKARYPLAPPCPTEAYKNATKNNNA
ncbi:MAG: hypothetical protein WKI04_04015 [Ferruginibacter sp.]